MAFSPDSSKLAIAQTDAIVFVYKVRKMLHRVGEGGGSDSAEGVPGEFAVSVSRLPAPLSLALNGATRRAFATGSRSPAPSHALRGLSRALSRCVRTVATSLCWVVVVVVVVVV
jgi:hypothetical protein